MPGSATSYNSFTELNRKVTDCSMCKRLVNFRSSVLKDSAKYSNENFWRKAIPSFGDAEGHMMVVGLAPAASGANRTGRVFTGDKSSDVLVAAFHSIGLSNQDFSISRDDGLQYRDMLLTLAVRCVPPDNIPGKDEIANCLPYLESEILLMKNLRSIVALGTVAFNSIKSIFKNMGFDVKGMKFVHGEFHQFGETRVYCCYHPSPRNINTGRTSPEDIKRVLCKARDYSLP